jgi:hypothetical protein
MSAFAKKLRLKAYYDIGDPEGESDHDAAVRGARSSALIEVAEAVDETLQINTELTPEDLSSWHR